jgi:putative ABC transport system permease protein
MGMLRFFRRGRWDDERARELESYLHIETDENLARGMTLDEARLAARRKLGNLTRTREVIYDMNTLTFLDTCWQDLRYGARLLRRNPAFAIIAILSLALGTGANTAIFQLVNAVRLRTLPVSHPEELAEIRIAGAPDGRTGWFSGPQPMFSHPLFEQLVARQQAFSSVFAWSMESLDLSSGGAIRPAEALYVSGEFFRTLGTQPAAGRLLTAGDDHRACPPLAVISHAFWQREYGGAPSAIGRTVPLDGHPFEIVGVTPPAFFGVEVGRAFDVAIPICTVAMIHPENPLLDRREGWWLGVIGRLKPGWSVERANAHIRSISPDLLRPTVSPRYDAEHVAGYLAQKYGVFRSDTGTSELRESYAQPLWILLGITGLVLLIACANLANLMLARATAREREMAVRLAIGASRFRIVRQMLSESLLLAVAGTIAGVLLAQWLSRFLVAFLDAQDSPLVVDLTFDWRMFAFTSTLAIAACLLFGLMPALRATRTPPGVAMKTGGRGMSERHERFGLRRTLVVVQVALSLVLLVGALLFVRSLRNLLTQDPGFRAEGLVVVSTDLSRTSIPATARALRFQEIATRLRTLPGIDGAVETSVPPIGDHFWNENIVIDGKRQPGAVDFSRVGRGYFGVVGTPLMAGREFDARDTAASPKVAIVNQAFVRKFLPDGNPVGRTFQLEEAPGDPRPFHEIVAVVGDAKNQDLHAAFAPLVFTSAAQDARPRPWIDIIIRSRLEPAEVNALVTRAVAEVSPSISLQFTTLPVRIHRALLRERLMAFLSGLFGVLAALIATIGLYGVMSYIVARRRTEIGIRMALGADRRSVIGLIVREAGYLVIAGLIVGGGLAVAAALSARTLLFNLQPWDPTTLAIAALGLGTVAILASWLPAARAARLDPTKALRDE